MTRQVEISTTRIMFGAGKLDTDKRYIRAAASGADFNIPRGETFYVVAEGGGPNAHLMAWRYSDGINVRSYTSGSTNASGDPAYTLVKI